MFTKIRRLPSPALVVAVVALVAALAGSAVALPGRNKVDRNDIQKSAVGGKQVKNDSVTGTDVAESTLGTVPSAGTADSAKNANHADNADHADHATNAASATNAKHADTAGDAEFAQSAASATYANSVNGVIPQSLFFKAPVATPATNQLQVEGLILSLGCNAGGQPIATVTSANNATELSGHVVSSGGANLTYADDNGFSNVDIAQTIVGSGTLTYAVGSSAVVTIDYGFDSSTVFSGQAGCAFWGTVVDAPAQF
jgi:hypothetical protein